MPNTSSTSAAIAFDGPPLRPVKVHGEDSGSKRDALIAAASDLMIANDTVDVSLHDIAKHAAANAALVRYYFGNKEGLMLALLERDVSGAIGAAGHLLDSKLTSEEKLRHHISGIIRTYYRYPYLNRLVRMVMRVSSPETAKKVAATLIVPLCDFYRRLIAEGCEQGTFRAIDPMLFYFTLVGICDQMFSGRCTLRAVYGVDEISDEFRSAFARHTADLILNGIKA